MNRRLAPLTLSLTLGLLTLNSAFANTGNETLRVVGLFKDTAIINIGEQTRTLRVGERGMGNIQLLQANSQEAVFRINGARVTRALSDNSVIHLAPRKETAEARIWANNGMYKMPGSINNQLVSFIMDTGASYISMSRSDALRLGIEYEQGQKTVMDTANGETVAHLITLDKVRVGEIEVRNVTAAVLEKIPPGQVLLGMSFLQNVELQNQGQVMLLRQRIE